VSRLTPSCVLMVCLQAAGNAVKRAADNLVKAAQKAAFDAQDDQAVVVKSRMVGGIAQVSHRATGTYLWSSQHMYRLNPCVAFGSI